jgi:hypothetical protein
MGGRRVAVQGAALCARAAAHEDRVTDIGPKQSLFLDTRHL